MTVSELIAQLQQYPEDMRVIVDGYEGGYDDIKSVHTIPIMVNVNDQSYMGSHDDPFYDDETADETAVHLTVLDYYQQ